MWLTVELPISALARFLFTNQLLHHAGVKRNTSFLFWCLLCVTCLRLSSPHPQIISLCLAFLFHLLLLKYVGVQITGEVSTGVLHVSLPICGWYWSSWTSTESCGPSFVVVFTLKEKEADGLFRIGCGGHNCCLLGCANQKEKKKMKAVYSKEMMAQM